MLYSFLDMLGFKKLINDSPCDKIAEIFAQFSNKKPLKTAYLGNRNIISEDTADALKMKVMSDSICFYIDVNVTNALLWLIMSCMEFQYELYQNEMPIFLRGAIVRGNLYVEKDTMFGNAKLLMSGNKAIREKVKRRIKYMLDMTIDNSIREKYLYLEKRL